MIGDAKVRGKRSSTTDAGPEFKKRNGKSFKTIAAGTDSDSGGDAEGHEAAKRSTKGMRPGPGSKGSTVEPYRTRNSAGQSFKTIGARDVQNESGRAVDAWCRGARKDYK